VEEVFLHRVLPDRLLTLLPVQVAVAALVVVELPDKE